MADVDKCGKTVEIKFWKYSQLRMIAHERDVRTRAQGTHDVTTPTHTTRVGALPQSHPGLCGTPVGPGNDTHGTPVPTQWEGRGWLDRTAL